MYWCWYECEVYFWQEFKKRIEIKLKQSCWDQQSWWIWIKFVSSIFHVMSMACFRWKSSNHYMKRKKGKKYIERSCGIWSAHMLAEARPVPETLSIYYWHTVFVSTHLDFKTHAFHNHHQLPPLFHSSHNAFCQHPIDCMVLELINGAINSLQNLLVHLPFILILSFYSKACNLFINKHCSNSSTKSLLGLFFDQV